MGWEQDFDEQWQAFVAAVQTSLQDKFSHNHRIDDSSANEILTREKERWEDRQHLHGAWLVILAKQHPRRADDLQRFADGRPIQARPVGWVEQTVKWARRRPALAALIAVSAIATITLLGGVWWSNQQLRLAATREQAESNRAELNYRRARDAVDELTAAGEKVLAGVPRMEPQRQLLLEKALEFYQGFLQEARDDTELRQETARSQRRVGEAVPRRRRAS